MMNEKQADKQIKKIKTTCCKTSWYRKGRANYRCEKCNKDVTLEIVLIYDAITK